jgi:hypothetical protein
MPLTVKASVNLHTRGYTTAASAKKSLMDFAEKKVPTRLKILQ